MDKKKLTTQELAQLKQLLSELMAMEVLDGEVLRKIVKKYPQPNGRVFSKYALLQGYQQLVSRQELPKNQQVLALLRMKPIRTSSGVTPVTVLTKPFPCPGKCIFCPNDIRMPKSYLSDEPGAQRAERNLFDPYLQTMSRLKAYRNIGHETSKVEIIILGGTWSFYPENYQIWFIKRCFDAMNDFSVNKDETLEIEERLLAEQAQREKLRQQRQTIEVKKKTYNEVIGEIYTAPEKLLGQDQSQQASWEELFAVQKVNEMAATHCVGLVIETRPDHISEAEVIRIRKLGCTKTQIGVQSLNDEVLTKNKRGHDVAATRKAFRLLRQAGLKIHAHWMPNLFGSSVEKDKADYLTLFNDPDFCPDELKIYPCSLIESAELMEYYQRGEWRPYTKEELLDVLTFCFANTPKYCRLTRVVRDIPSQYIVTGNKQTNFREIVEQNLQKNNTLVHEIRSREIRLQTVNEQMTKINDVQYRTSVADEHFIEAVNEGKLLGFLRLSLPKIPNYIDELKESAMIREVHVYGQTTKVGEGNNERAQHRGIGKRLIQEAIRIARENHFTKLQVISSVGTREYYRKNGFLDGQLYQFQLIG